MKLYNVEILWAQNLSLSLENLNKKFVSSGKVFVVVNVIYSVSSPFKNTKLCKTRNE